MQILVRSQPLLHKDTELLPSVVKSEMGFHAFDRDSPSSKTPIQRTLSQQSGDYQKCLNLRAAADADLMLEVLEIPLLQKRVNASRLSKQERPLDGYYRKSNLDRLYLEPPEQAL